MKKLGLKQKIWLSIFLISFFMILAMGGLTKFLYEKFYVDKQIETILARGQSLEKVYYDGSEEQFLQMVDWANEHFDCTVIYSDNPMLLSGAAPFEVIGEENLISYEERQVLLNGDELIMIREHERFNQQILAIVLPLFQNEKLVAALFLYRPISSVYEPFQPITTILVVATIVLILLLIFMAKKITSYVVKPLVHMMDVTKQFGDGDLSKRIDIKQEDELGQLADSFNLMAEKLEMEENKRKQFLANVSHELRTPISYMKNFSEAFEEGVIDEEQYVKTVKKEADRLGRLVHDLLDLAQLEGESYPMNETILPFAQFIDDLIDRYKIEAKKKNITIIKELDDEVIVFGDEDRLTQVFNNIMENSLKYTSVDGKIIVKLAKDKHFTELSIEDNGEGIPAEDIPKITDRFYRVDKSRARKEGGTGLGLAIVQQIVKNHRGTLSIKSTVGKGTKVTIKLPLYEEEGQI